MDALSAALNAVRMTGAIFYNLECTAPWGFIVPPLSGVARSLAPGTERLVSYHLVTEGRATCRFGDEPAVILEAGDVVIIPHGDAHTVTNGSPATLTDAGAPLSEAIGGELTSLKLGGGGEATHFICGFFGCERDADRMFLSGLPTMVKINVRGDAAGAWIESSVRHLVAEANAGRPGLSVLLSKMAEALFIEALRHYMEQLPQEQTGWLAGARDSVVGAALALMHRQPSYPWTIAALAAEAGASRTVLIERFARFLGEPPLTYLARWRLQLAARTLQTSRSTILHIAADSGYESEAAFNRAFKREFGLPPARYRRRHAGSDASAAKRRSGMR
ncbi:MAG: cupin domain-containing protein [Rhodospirillaceae bacterium]